MKRLMLVAALAVAQSGCAASQEDAPILFGNAYAVTSGEAGCSPETTQFISQGYLDVSGGGNYTLAMSVRSTIPTARVVVIGDSPVNIGGATAVLGEYVYRYDAPAELGLPEEEVTVTHSVVTAGTGGTSHLFVQAFGPQALKQLRANIKPGTEPVAVIARVKARGHLGSTHQVESNEFFFPVRVYSSGFSGSCPPGYILGGICNPGQDESICKPDPSATP